MHFLDRFRFNPSQAAQPVRDRFDQAMRPRSLAEFTGQDHIKAALTTLAVHALDRLDDKGRVAAELGHEETQELGLG